jgi:hypothetical protein
VPNRWLAGDAHSMLRGRNLVLAAYAALERRASPVERFARTA